uniref:Uncharacterized protein n=1 Tax=Aotus nancymaae TaxID=37293 RepID=A0A2K5C7L5_AOTNA
MFGLQRNALIGLNLYCEWAGLGTGSGGTTPPGGRLLATEKEASAQREVGGGEAGVVIGGSAGASPSAALTPDARGSCGRCWFFAPTRRAAPLEEMEAPAADAIMSPEEELDRYEPEPLGKRPAVLPLLELVEEPGNDSSTDGSLPSTPPTSLEIISRYLREQATGAKDTKPMDRSGAASRKALETLRRVGDGVQRNHETAFQVLPCRRPRRWHQKCAAGFCRCCWSRSWFGISNKIAL